MYLCHPQGELSEWLKEPASKTGVRQRTGGSNPSLTASKPASAGFSRLVRDKSPLYVTLTPNPSPRERGSAAEAAGLVRSAAANPSHSFPGRRLMAPSARPGPPTHHFVHQTPPLLYKKSPRPCLVHQTAFWCKELFRYFTIFEGAGYNLVQTLL